MASDRETLAHIRKRLNIQPSDLSDDQILKEIERGKKEIGRELRENLTRGGEIDVYNLGEAAEDALKSYAAFRVKGKAHGRGSNGPPAHSNKGGKVPKSVSEMRRTDLPDSAMGQLRDETIRNMKRLNNGN